MIRLGIDTGGTFTDAVLWSDDGGILGTCKVPSDNANPANAVYAAACRVCEQCGVDVGDVDDLVHGTTVATNVSLETDGPRIALLTTKGFKDVLEIGRLTRPASALYDLMDAGRKPLVARRDRFEITERIDKDGLVVDALAEEDVRRAVRSIVERGIESIAVCYLFSFANPAHERETERIIKSMAPNMNVSLSCDILPQIREFERTAATVVNAYLQPVCKPYLESLKAKLVNGGITANIWVMQSNGGVTTPQHAAESPINLLMSGPSGGVVAAQDLARECAADDVISVDMGGTSFDVSCVVDGNVALTSLGETMGLPLRIPTVDISTIGTGGGSIAYTDVAGQLHVGPRSAGAQPGPASYGHGGKLPTVTDANVVIGYIPNQEKLGQDITVSRESAVRACEPLAHELGLSVLELAYGIRRISTSSMAGAVRKISVGKGRDPRTFSLVAFGGAGPLHAVDIARAMGIKRVVIPCNAGVLSAAGLVKSNVVRTYTHSLVGTTVNEQTMANAAKELLEQAKSFEESLPEGKASYRFSLDMRYAGQNETIAVPIPDPFATGVITQAHAEFNRQHDLLNGYANDELEQNIDALNLLFEKSVTQEAENPQAAGTEVGIEVEAEAEAGAAPTAETEPAKAEAAGAPATAGIADASATPDAQENASASIEQAIATGARTIWNADGTTSRIPVVNLDTIENACAAQTPCIIASSTTTIVVPEKTSCSIDEKGNVVIDIEE